MKPEITVIICAFALVCSSCVLNTPKNDVEYNGLNTIEIANVNDLISFYQYTEDRIPLISGHRGGRVKGFPENSLETFANTLSYTLPLLK